MRPSISTSRITIVVSAQNKNAALVQIKKVDPNGGDFALEVGLSPSGNLPATHYWCSWMCTPDEETQLTGYLAGVGSAPNRPRIYDGDLIAPQQILTELGLQRINVVADGA